MKKLLKLVMIGMALAGGRRYRNRMIDPYASHNAYEYGVGYHPVNSYIHRKSRKRMKRKMKKQMLKRALRQIF